jgi:TRAP-type C4-dicarboxylate transport system permease small subunit
MTAVAIILGILLVGSLITAVFIIEKMGANIERLNEENKTLKQRVEELEAQQKKKGKKKDGNTQN